MAEAVSATDACAHFLNSLDPDKARDERPLVQRFVDWFGPARQMSELTGEQVTAFAGLQEHADDAALEPVRAFLAYCARLAFTDGLLVPYLHRPDEPGAAAAGQQPLTVDGYSMTIEGVATLEQELAALKARRPQMADVLRLAMQDKDFRENAPLDAARDEQGHLEARIREIEHRLRHAVIIDRDAKRGRANVGSTVRVLNLSSEREQTLRLVSPAEVDPARGKISVESPFGRAVIHHSVGDEVTVEAPAGQMRLRLLEVID